MYEYIPNNQEVSLVGMRVWAKENIPNVNDKMHDVINLAKLMGYTVKSEPTFDNEEYIVEVTLVFRNGFETIHLKFSTPQTGRGIHYINVISSRPFKNFRETEIIKAIEYVQELL